MTDQQALDLAALPQFASKVSLLSCTGALLNSEWVVYAGHCSNFTNLARVTVVYNIGGQNHSRAGTVYLARSGDPGYDDVALVHLDAPITQAVTWVAPYRGFDEFQRLGWQVGRGTYGALGVNTVSPDGNFRAMTQSTISTKRETDSGAGSSIIPQHVYYDYNGSPAVASPNPTTTLYEGGTGPGDSGGPYYIYKQGRFFNASVVSGPHNGSYRNGRLSTHLDVIIARTGLDFAYPQALKPQATWVAQDLTNTLGNLAPVSAWPDRIRQLTWSDGVAGTAAAPVLVAGATPTGLAAVRFGGGQALGLVAAKNPFANETAMSVALVVRATANGSGTEADPFGTTGILDASSAGGGPRWGLSFAGNGRFGWNLDDINGSVKSIFRGDAANGSAAEGDWHVVVATWDGSEISHDNAGDDRNMKIFVDTMDQSSRLQGPQHFNVGRAAIDLLLGQSSSNAAGGFQGEIAEIRFLSGELELHEVDRLLTGLRARYINGSPGVVFERPWSERIALPIGQSLRTRGHLTGGGRDLSWNMISGPAPVAFSDIYSADTDMEFEAPGNYELEATVSNGVTIGTTRLSVTVNLPGADPTSLAPLAVPGNWIDADLGASGLGGAAQGAGSFTLTAAGKGLGVGEGHTYDEGRFYWKGVAGDFDFMARLDSLGNASGPTRAGLMVRGGPGPTEAAAFAGFAPDGKLYTLTRRAGGYWGDLTVVDNPGLGLPAYLKVERRGDSIQFKLSEDGLTFSAVGQGGVVLLPGVARVGMFATSGNAANTVQAVFSQLQLSQIGPARASTTALTGNFSTASTLAYYPQFSGSREPWLSVSSASETTRLTFSPTYVNEKEVLQAAPPVGGDYLTRFSLDDGNTVTYLERLKPIRFNLRYDFDVDADTEGWTANNVSGLSVAGGSISGTATTTDPQLARSGLSLNGSSFTRLSVRLRTDVNSPIQLFWGRSGAGGFAVERRATVNYTGGGAYQTLVFNLDGISEWSGETITALRLDPMEGASITGKKFEIDFIDISDGQPPPDSDALPRFDFDRTGDFDGWEAIKDITNAYVAGGSLHARSTGIDPILQKEGVGFPADGVNSLLVRVRVSGGGALQLFWGTSQASGFAAIRSATIPVVGGNVWQTVRLPLAGNPEWDGQTITRLRLDPINQTNVDFSISAIVFSGGDADRDGMPDAFELANDFAPLDSSDAAEDADGNGVSNLAEYTAGTNPRNAADRFQVSSTGWSASGFEVRFAGKAGRAYRLLRNLDLSAGAWIPVTSLGPLAADQPAVLIDPQSYDRAFYKVEVYLP